ncbi:unnamed protein product [Microthlaspi erraticum]|uniref:Reverse transcriptase n=1 Tax=Microthlaspi erraticum TaxID=1685480 RepID=A0A6D2HZG0_9BRAS|nr:unnamed protein product [Microthlaspi erraticum]
MGKIDDLAEELHRSMESMAERWERQEKTNDHTNQNFSEINANLSRLTETLARMEATINNPTANQWNPSTSQQNPANFTSQSPPVREVRNPNQPEPGDNRPLGYRGINSLLENRNVVLKKIELPALDGSSPYSWISLAERFFRLGRYSDEERLDLLSITLKGPALNWFNHEMLRNPFRDWAQFKKRMIARFSQKIEENPGKRLFSLKQRGSIEDYVNEFEELTTIVTGIDEENLEHMFYIGLKPEMKEVIKMQNPRGLTNCFNAVIAMEGSAFCKSMAEAVNPFRRASSSLPLRGSTFYNAQRPGRNTSSDSVEKTSNPSNGKPPWRNGVGKNYSGMIKLTPAEIAEKRHLGLCYKCPEKWSKTHECQNMLLQVFTVINDEEVEILEEDWSVGLEEIDNVDPVLMELSLYSYLGLDSPVVTKLWGEINNTKVVVMIDSGATHNFMDPSVLNKTQLSPTRNRGLEVLLGTGITVNGSGVCRDVAVTLQTHEFQMDFVVLELGNADVILGVVWLRTLGKCETDWETHEMSFMYKGSKITLYGDPGLQKRGRSFRDNQALNCLELASFDMDLGEWNQTEVITEVPEVVEDVLTKFQHIFAEPTELPLVRGNEHTINLLPGTGPVSVRPYRYPHAYKEEMEKLVSQMLEAGTIRPSKSPFSSPVLLVKKKDGSWRFCIDYRALNKVTVADKFPIPVIDQLLDELHGAKIFSKLDLRAGYHQIRMQEKDVEKTAFRTSNGHYEFLVMPFGLTNAPATFQALMNELFRPFLGDFVLVFFDDILILSSSLEAHVEHLSTVLTIFESHQLFANRKKCLFGQVQVDYLGHIISEEGVATDPSKTEAMQKWPVPKSVKELRGFLGLTGYYRNFLKGYGAIARPLTELLKKDGFEWCKRAELAFEELKKAMMTAPVLALPNFDEVFIVEDDASGYGVGALLMQNQRPIAYFSSGLSDREQMKPIYERELMAVVMAIQKWRHYLLGRKFVVHTDQKSLKFLLEQREVSMEYQKWLTKLLGYDFDIVFKPGVENKAADGLSRIVHEESAPTFNQLFSLTVPTNLQLQDIYKEIDADAQIQEQLKRVMDGTEENKEYTVVDGKLRFKRRLVIPRSSKHLPLILHEYHTGLVGGHSGVLKTLKRIQSVFYWRKMTKDIQQFVAECDTCQRHKYSTLSPAGLLQPLPIPSQIWEDFSMDFIEGLPVSQGVNVILVVVDRLSKFSHFLRLKHPFTATDVANKFTQEVVRLHGFPASIVSDRDRIFLSSFWKELFKQVGTRLKYSTAFHPQSDGQTEVLNRCLETYLRCFASSQPKTWAKYLNWAELWYNTSYHTAIGRTPFAVVYGREAPVLLRFEEGSTANFELETSLKERDAVLAEIKAHLVIAQARMKDNADKHRRELEFVLIVCGLPESSKIHPVFHVSQLKSVLGSNHQVSPLPDSFASNPALVIEPEEILETRYDATCRLEGLVQWKGLPAHEHTWVRASDLIQ